MQKNCSPSVVHRPSVHGASSGWHDGKHNASAPSFATMQVVAGSAHDGSSADPAQNDTQVPASVSGSTSQHIEWMSQSSTPESALSTAVHGSPTACGASATGVQIVSFHELPPSFANGMHFIPTGQSRSQIEQPVIGTPPKSASGLNEGPSSTTPLSSSTPSSSSPSSGSPELVIVVPGIVVLGSGIVLAALALVGSPSS